jgi:CPA2 family monovalent cation:H+ antiporter-2
MDPFPIDRLVIDLLIVLTAGLVSGAICKRLGISLLVGYLMIGAIIGQGMFGLVSQEHHELEYLARAGALLLLFAVGIEFSLEELMRLRRYFLVGGAVQMLLVAVPLALIGWMIGLTWQAAALLGAAGSLSSTILVFKALNEWGQTATPHGRRAIAVLLFQDIALVPMMLAIPLLTGTGEGSSGMAFALLLGIAILFVVAVQLLRRTIASLIVPALANLRSIELVVLFTILVLAGTCWLAFSIGLPPAIGALAAGLMLSGNRLTQQIDTLILPFRESFAAVFFVTLGTLLQPQAFVHEPLLLMAGLLSVILLKWTAATVAMRATGLSWRASAGMGIGLAQLGEFSFLIVAIGVTQGVLTDLDYNRTLFIAMGTLLLTPQMMKFGLAWTEPEPVEDAQPALTGLEEHDASTHAVVIGAGLIGRKTAARLETLGVHVCLIDQSPINLYPFAQQGFQTVTGDAIDVQVLTRANVRACRLGVVCVPDDPVAGQIVAILRKMNPKMFILVRCRFFSNVAHLTKVGADQAISEEQETSVAVSRVCEQILWQAEPKQKRESPET